MTQQGHWVAGVAAGQHGVPDGGRQHAPAVVHGLAAQPLARAVRLLPRQKPAAALAVGAEALLGLPAGRRPGVRRPGLAVLLGVPGRWAAFALLLDGVRSQPSMPMCVVVAL